MYVELKTGFNDDGPAWIGRVLGQRVRRSPCHLGAITNCARELLEPQGVRTRCDRVDQAAG